MKKIKSQNWCKMPSIKSSKKKQNNKFWVKKSIVKKKITLHFRWSPNKLQFWIYSEKETLTFFHLKLLKLGLEDIKLSMNGLSWLKLNQAKLILFISSMWFKLLRIISCLSGGKWKLKNQKLTIKENISWETHKKMFLRVKLLLLENL